jgi:hypothetical protein
MNITAKDIDNIIYTIFHVSPEKLHSLYGTANERDLRNLAMYKCREYLNWSYTRISKYYGRKGHNTAMNNVTSAKNLIETDKSFRQKNDMLDSWLIYKGLLKKKKEQYNLNYRLRKKGFTVDYQSRTIDLPFPHNLQKMEVLKKSDLIKKNKYSVQLSLFKYQTNT